MIRPRAPRKTPERPRTQEPTRPPPTTKRCSSITRAGSATTAVSIPCSPNSPQRSCAASPPSSWSSASSRLTAPAATTCSVQHPAVHAVSKGQKVALEFRHFDLLADEPAETHVAILFGDQLQWETHLPIPSSARDDSLGLRGDDRPGHRRADPTASAQPRTEHLHVRVAPYTAVTSGPMRGSGSRPARASSPIELACTR